MLIHNNPLNQATFFTWKLNYQALAQHQLFEMRWLYKVWEGLTWQCNLSIIRLVMGLPMQLSGKESTCQSRRRGFDTCIRKIPWKRNGNPFQYSCLKIFMNREAWWATVDEVSKSQTRLSERACIQNSSSDGIKLLHLSNPYIRDEWIHKWGPKT